MYNHISFQLPSTGKKAMRLNPALPDWAQVDTFSPETAESNISDWENNAVLQKGMQNVFGMIKLIDDNVGKMLQFFDNENLADDTIVIFTSDHGMYKITLHNNNVYIIHVPTVWFIPQLILISILL